MEAIAAGAMDLIVSNPPYVPIAQREGLQREVRDWEPHVALFAARPGLRSTIASWPMPRGSSAPAGWLIMELGFGSRGLRANLLGGWREVRIEPDLAGIPRVIAARKKTTMPTRNESDRLRHFPGG